MHIVPKSISMFFSGSTIIAEDTPTVIQVFSVFLYVLFFAQQFKTPDYKRQAVMESGVAS